MAKTITSRPKVGQRKPPALQPLKKPQKPVVPQSCLIAKAQAY